MGRGAFNKSGLLSPTLSSCGEERENISSGQGVVVSSKLSCCGATEEESVIWKVRPWKPDSDDDSGGLTFQQRSARGRAEPQPVGRAPHSELVGFWPGRLKTQADGR